MNPNASQPAPITPAKSLSWSGRTDRGKVRPNNEDAFLGIRFDAREVQRLGRHGESSLEHADFVFAVSDGMGGAKAGEFASRLTVEKITTLLPRSCEASRRAPSGGFTAVLVELFDQIHRTLAYLGGSYEECSGMECTLSMCWFTPGWMYFGHIGDGRIYHLSARQPVLKQLTEDDTHVGWLRRTGKLNEREARSHPGRTVLQKSLGGTNQFVKPQVGALQPQPGDLFLLCTDGLAEGLHDSLLEEMLRSIQNAPPAADPSIRLVETSLAGDGRDNTTALIVQMF